MRLCGLILISYLYLYSSDLTETNIIDTTHKYISDRVENISNFTDDVTSKTLSYAQQTQSNLEDIDELFKNEKYLEETKKSYLRLSTDYNYNSLESNEFNVKLSAKLALNKSRKNLKLYISGFQQDNLEEIIDRNKYEDSAPEIGISYLIELKDNIETKYYLGIRSLYPYVRARFLYKKMINSWLIEPIQTAEYSSKDEFKEGTKLYLDRQVFEKVKFRWEFARSTSSKRDGMDYSSVASIFWTPQEKTGLQFSQGIYGNTKYEFVVDEVTKETQRYSKINNYVTTLTLRKNIYRNWLFYEVSPSVNFHKSHDFKPNYRLYLRLDAFLGKL